MNVLMIVYWTFQRQDMFITWTNINIIINFFILIKHPQYFNN